MVAPKHYGSAYTMADYTSETHNIFASASYIPTAELSFTGTVNYNKSTGGLEKVIFPSVADLLGGDLPHHDVTFEEMNTYSDLDYALIQVTFGLKYKLTPTVTMTADMDYADLDDKAGGYVYGVESGSYFMVRSGIRFDF